MPQIKNKSRKKIEGEKERERERLSFILIQFICKFRSKYKIEFKLIWKLSFFKNGGNYKYKIFPPGPFPRGRAHGEVFHFEMKSEIRIGQGGMGERARRKRGDLKIDT